MVALLKVTVPGVTVMVPYDFHFLASNTLSGKVSQNWTYPMFTNPQFLAVRKLLRPLLPANAWSRPETLPVPVPEVVVVVVVGF